MMGGGMGAKKKTGGRGDIGRMEGGGPGKGKGKGDAGLLEVTLADMCH